MRNVLVSLLGGCLALAPAPAQQGGRFADLALPGGTAAAQIVGQGKLITCREGGALHVFSAFAARWQTLAAAPGATLHLHNDCLLIADGAQWTAFSSYTGRAAALAVSPAAQLLNPGGQRNDSVLLVADGPEVHAFSCFSGGWTHRTPGAAYDHAVQRHVALLAIDSAPIATLAAFDAYTGRWHDLAIPVLTQGLSCDGMAGFAFGGNVVHAFSALHCRWQSAAVPAGAAFVRGDDWGLYHDATGMVGFSAVHGSFATAPYGAAAVPYVADLACIAETPHGLVAFSAPRGRFSAPLGPNAANVTLATAVAVIVDGLQVTGYSAVHDSSATIALDSAGVAASNVVGAVVANGTGAPHCYSALRGTWSPAPLDSQPGLPLLTTTTALVAAASGVHAFSAHSGNWVSLPVQATLAGNNTSAPAAAWDATHVHAFDARTDTWHAVARTSATPPAVLIWRTCLLVVDGQTVHGFGAQDGRWSTLPLPEPYVVATCNSECSRVATATHLIAHGAVAPLASFAQFPEFRRVQPIGADAPFAVHLAGGGVAAIAGGLLAPAPAPVPPFGELWLQQPFAAVLLGAAAPAETARFGFPVPASAGLIGLSVAFQALRIPALEPPALTGVAVLRLL